MMGGGPEQAVRLCTLRRTELKCAICEILTLLGLVSPCIPIEDHKGSGKYVVLVEAAG